MNQQSSLGAFNIPSRTEEFPFPSCDLQAGFGSSGRVYISENQASPRSGPAHPFLGQSHHSLISTQSMPASCGTAQGVMPKGAVSVSSCLAESLLQKLVWF